MSAAAKVTPISSAIATSMQSYDDQFKAAVRAVDMAEDRCQKAAREQSAAQVDRDRAKAALLELMDGDCVVYGDQLLTRDGKGGIHIKKVRVVGLL